LIPGSLKKSPSGSVKLWPLTVTSTLVPALPPQGVTTSKRGAARLASEGWAALDRGKKGPVERVRRIRITSNHRAARHCDWISTMNWPPLNPNRSRNLLVGKRSCPELLIHRPRPTGGALCRRAEEHFLIRTGLSASIATEGPGGKRLFPRGKN